MFAHIFIISIDLFIKAGSKGNVQMAQTDRLFGPSLFACFTLSYTLGCAHAQLVMNIRCRIIGKRRFVQTAD